MIEPGLAKFAERIEQFLRTSSLAASYSSLPARTYHMTIYSIYQCGNQMIPPVERWVNATGHTISNRYFLPHEVLQEQHDRASCIIKKYLNEPLHIKYASLNIGERNIKLLLEVDDESMERIRIAREEFVKIYEDFDWSMEPINDKLHITLAYVYAPMDKTDVEEWNQLNKLVRGFSGARFILPSVYLFDSMTNYIPYRKTNEIECQLLLQ